jgi:hypothetical protein
LSNFAGAGGLTSRFGAEAAASGAAFAGAITGDCGAEAGVTAGFEAAVNDDAQ